MTITVKVNNNFTKEEATLFITLLNHIKNFKKWHSEEKDANSGVSQEAGNEDVQDEFEVIVLVEVESEYKPT